MAAAIIIVFGLGSIIFLSAILLGMAVLLRGQWDTMGQTTPSAARSSATPSSSSSSSSPSASPETALGPASPAPRRPRSPYLDR